MLTQEEYEKAAKLTGWYRKLHPEEFEDAEVKKPVTRKKAVKESE